jgi:hypothetical protein
MTEWRIGSRIVGSPDERILSIGLRVEEPLFVLRQGVDLRLGTRVRGEGLVEKPKEAGRRVGFLRKDERWTYESCSVAYLGLIELGVRKQLGGVADGVLDAAASGLLLGTSGLLGLSLFGGRGLGFTFAFLEFALFGNLAGGCVGLGVLDDGRGLEGAFAFSG